MSNGSPPISSHSGGENVERPAPARSGDSSLLRDVERLRKEQAVERRTRSDESRVAARSELWSEYELIQSKMEKIADWEVRIRGWSVTAVLIGLLAAKGRVNVQFATTLVVAVVLVGALEYRQTLFRASLATRVHAIESRLHALSAGLLHDRFGPRIGSTLGRPFLTKNRFDALILRHDLILFYGSLILMCIASAYTATRTQEQQHAVPDARTDTGPSPSPLPHRQPASLGPSGDAQSADEIVVGPPSQDNVESQMHISPTEPADGSVVHGE